MTSRARIDEVTARTVESLWALWRGIDPAVRDRVATTATADAAALAEVFYETLMQDPRAAGFLSHEMVQQRLRASMARWIANTFSIRVEEDLHRVVADNFHVGLVHARINMPLTLINSGMRVIKKDLARRTVAGAGALSPAQTAEAVLFLGEVLDILADTMHEAYISDLVGAARQQQSLKMHMTGQTLALESERLKTSLFDWLRSVMVALYDRGDRPAPIPPLETSDFGLWLEHKAELTFGQLAELDTLRRLVSAATVRAEEAAGGTADGAFIKRLDRDVTEIAYLLSTITARAMEMESGRDSLTRLLTRRFLPAILQREVSMSVRHGKRFAVLLVDGDHFKRINDDFGHDAGDKVLMALADVLMHSVRGGDFVFRYGGEEFLVVLAEIDDASMLQRAEQIRRTVETTLVTIGPGRTLPVTVSIGAALHDGHPDYERVIKAADEALYRAKAAGRNRVAVAPDEGQ